MTRTEPEVAGKAGDRVSSGLSYITATILNATKQWLWPICAVTVIWHRCDSVA